MFKYTKRLILDIRFWLVELKLRCKENAELDRIENEEWVILWQVWAIT